MTTEIKGNIREIPITNEDDADKIRQFAVQNADFFTENLAKITGAIMRGDLETATVGFSYCMASAYASGVSDGIKRTQELL